LLILSLVLVTVALVFLFAFTSAFHDAANVMATIVMTRALSRKKALLMVTACEIIAPFFLGTAVAKMIGKNIIDPSAFEAIALPISAAFIIAVLIGTIIWNLITWVCGFPSSSSHALVGGMVGACLAAYGTHRILLQGLLYVLASLIISPLLGLIFGFLILKVVFYFSRNATPKINYFFTRMQIPSSIALALSHGANDVQKSIGLMAMSFFILGISPTFQIDFWMIASCGVVTALGAVSGGWRIIKTVGSKIYRLKQVHAFCAQTSSAAVILGASLAGGPVSTTHVVSSTIMGVGAGYRASAVRWGVAKNIIVAWFITIPASGGLAGLSFFLVRFVLSHI
jgi:PiT family inorganic phosphate transporter